MNDKPYIIPKPTSPYAALDFPDGIPVTHPIPVGMSDGNLLWDLDFDRATAAQLLSIAQLVATARQIHIDEVIAGIKQTQNFGIHHLHVAGLVGDDTSPDYLEAFGRAYRAKMLLEQVPVPIVLVVQLLDAIALYSELGQAVCMVGSNDPKSETAELVGNWLDNIPPAIAQYAPELGQMLIDKREEDCDRMLSLLQSTDCTQEVKVPIGGYEAYLAIGCLQLMSRNTESKIIDTIRHFIRTLSDGVVQLVPEVNWLIERGWHPEFDGGGE
jgi:hypothetical protein